ncbi:DUF433 domain-containing protein [Mycobacterium sp. NPDC049093]
MAFPVELTVALTGATRAQLATWRRPPVLLAPEHGSKPVALYSFRDLTALRMLSYIRAKTSLQRIRVAMDTLERFNYTDHPSAYKLVTDGDSIFLMEDDRAIDLVKIPGQVVIAGLEQVFEPFRNFKDKPVSAFLRPRHEVDLEPGRMGGWPCIRGTRVGYDTVASLQRGPRGVPACEVHNFFPGVSEAAATDALDWDDEVRAS